MDWKLKPLADAPKDGTPIVACMEMNDEGDFLQTIWWNEESGRWDDTMSSQWEETDFLGWIGTAEDIYRSITGEAA